MATRMLPNAEILLSGLVAPSKPTQPTLVLNDGQKVYIMHRGLWHEATVDCADNESKQAILSIPGYGDTIAKNYYDIHTNLQGGIPCIKCNEAFKAASLLRALPQYLTAGLRERIQTILVSAVVNGPPASVETGNLPARETVVNKMQWQGLDAGEKPLCVQEGQRVFVLSGAFWNVVTVQKILSEHRAECTLLSSGEPADYALQDIRTTQPDGSLVLISADQRAAFSMLVQDTVTEYLTGTTAQTIEALLIKTVMEGQG